MTRLLPIAHNAAAYRGIPLRDAKVWEPALLAIIHRHGLFSTAVTQFADGMNPVFAVGRECVVKLIPPFLASVATREIEVLNFLTDHPQVPVARLLAHGLIDDWYYVVATRIDGEPLHRVWPGMNREARLQFSAEYGRLFSTLHALPIGNLLPGGIVWSDFCRTSIARWTERRDFPRLPPQLQADGPRFLARHGPALVSDRQVLLHGDLAPENLLVRPKGGTWEIAGAIDFGNAMRGAATFDLTAASILLQPGDRTTVHALLAPCTREQIADLRPLLMAGTLIHPMGDLPECLGLFPGAGSCATWDEVALKFWPE
jgi:hygromycin-B 7''-O-kinase